MKKLLMALFILGINSSAFAIDYGVAYIEKMYAVKKTEGKSNPDLNPVKKSNELKKLEIKRDRMNKNDLVCEAFSSAIAGNAGIEDDFFEHPVKVKRLNNQLIQASYHNVGRREKVDFDVSCNNGQCQINDEFYNGVSYKNELKKCK